MSEPGMAAPAAAEVAGRVLVVDDEPKNRELLKAVLEAHGHLVSEAADGQEGLSATTEGLPDVVLLDVQLPDMSGFDVCAELERRNGSAPAIVLVSSRDVVDYGDLVQNSCACGFIAKADLSGEAVAALLP